tara:strand:+ start:229 stop:1605 length:1377 start_codon:yes stop_codon:yes gene_type:complete
MNLFEKVKNIRKDLQEKRKFPGDESGAYKAAKDDLEARKGFNKNKSGGLKADEKNPYVKREVRRGRVKDLGGDIYDQPKFSQKEFEKSLKLKSPNKPKTPSQSSLIGAGGGPGTKPPSSKPTSPIKKPFEKPADPFAGSYDTPGEVRVKGLEKKAFRKTKPSDIQLPKSFTDFQKNLQNYKDRDLPGGPRKPSKVKVSGADNLTRQDVGMAPPDKPRKVKQADISKKIARQNKEYNVDRKIKADDAKRFKDFEADAKFAKDKFRKQRDAVAKKKTLTGAEKSKAARELNRKARSASELQKSYKLASQGYGTPGVTPIAKASDLKAVTGSAKVTINKTLGKRTTKAPSKFRKIVDKIRTSKIGSKVVKGLSKSRYGKIAGAALGVAGAVAGISALSKPKTDKTALNLSSKKDVVRGPVIKDLSTGKPKRFQLGKPVTDDDLKGTTFAKKIKIKTNTKNT